MRMEKWESAIDNERIAKSCCLRDHSMKPTVPHVARIAANGAVTAGLKTPDID